MAYTYDFKVVISGKQVEVYQYKKNILRDYEKKQEQREIKEKELKQLDLFEQQEIKKQKMQSSLNRAKTEIRRLINSNPQLNKFLTLTFAKNITNLKETNYIFNQFIKRISYKYPNFEYLAVPEFQKRGAVHYHLLCKLPFVEIAEIELMWGQGFIRINKIESVNNVGAYVCKYLNKDLFDERSFNKKKFFRSQTLLKPIELLGVIAKRFAERYLSKLIPVFKRTFSSDWSGEVEYSAYSLKFVLVKTGFQRYRAINSF